MYEIAVCGKDTQERRLMVVRLLKSQRDRKLWIHRFDTTSELLEAMKDIRYSAVYLEAGKQNENYCDQALAIRAMDSKVVLSVYGSDPTLSSRIFECQPFRYITRQMEQSVVSTYLLACLEQMETRGSEQIVVGKTKKRQIMMRPFDIMFIEKKARNLRIHIDEESRKRYWIEEERDIEEELSDIRFGGKLTDLYRGIGPYGFGYPHDSYIVNYRYIASHNGNEMRLVGLDQPFRIARSKSKDFLRKKNLYDLAVCSDTWSMGGEL